MKEKEEKRDILGQPLSEGSYVAVAHHNGLYVCVIKKITPKKLRVRNIKSSPESDGWLVYSTETVKLSGEDALAYILTYAK